MDRHRAAFEYDWRARFQLPLRVVGESMTWGEAVRLSLRLLNDTSSHVAAAASGWAHPLDRVDATLRDLYDLTHAIAWQQGGGKRSAKPKPYPRPWPKDGAKRFGTARMTPEQVRAVIARHRTEASDG